MGSPYERLPEHRWRAKTQTLITAYPIDCEEIVEVVLDQWSGIFKSRIGKIGLRIGREIFPKPQIMGDYLHELIPYELAARYPGRWRRDTSGTDKDLVNLEDEFFSTEIKTSSHASGIFGNRSYAQPTKAGKKSKSGYFLTVNFEGWGRARIVGKPIVTIIRLGWLDHVDWKGQAAQTGQQSSILPSAYGTKLIELYRAG